MENSIELCERIQSLETRIRDLEAKDKIRDVLHRYARSVDRCDAAGLKECYWPDGFDDHGFFGGPAHEFADFVVPILKQAESSIHQITNEIIEVDGDIAFSECYWKVLHRLRKGKEFLDYMHEGRYIDKFERRNGEWKISHRAIIGDSDRLHQVPDFRQLMKDAMAAMGSDIEPYDENFLGKRHPDDLVYKNLDFTSYMDKDRAPIKELWAPFISMAPILQSRGKQRIVRMFKRLRGK